jgi:hypothetical protein
MSIKWNIYIKPDYFKMKQNKVKGKNPFHDFTNLAKVKRYFKYLNSFHINNLIQYIYDDECDI